MRKKAESYHSLGGNDLKVSHWAISLNCSIYHLFTRPNWVPSQKQMGLCVCVGGIQVQIAASILYPGNMHACL